MSEPALSYVVAAWNAGGFITQAIESALAQASIQALELEVIVIDDASADNTEAVVRAINDPRLLYHRLPQNRGPAQARNVGFEMARGRWIGVLDADDYLLAGRSERLVAHAEAAGLDICADNVWIEAQDQQGARRLHIPETLDGEAESIDFKSYCARNLMFGSNANYGYLKPIFRAGFLREQTLAYRARLRIGEDFLLVAEALLKGARFERIRQAGYVYMSRSGSISHRLSPEHAHAMIAEDERLLTEYVVMSLADQAAMRAHLRSLRSGLAFTQMVDALKQRNVAAFLRHVSCYPSALQHFAMPLSARLSRVRDRQREGSPQPTSISH